MKCPKCGHEVSDTALFCPECGTSLAENNENAKDDSAKSNQETELNQTAKSVESVLSSDDECKDLPSDEASSNESTETPSSQDKESSEGSTDMPNETPLESIKVSQAGEPQPSENTSAGTSTGTISEKFKALDKKVRYGIIGGAAVVAIALIAFVGTTFFGGVPADVAKQAFISQSSLVTNGAVPSNYTNETPYEVTEFKVDSEDTALQSTEQMQIARTFYGTDQIKALTCSGKVANESFETSFSAMVYVAKINNQWMPLDGTSADMLSETTVPLKGVDNMNTSTSGQEVSYSDFSSTLDESNGTYTSAASGTETHTFWFGTDTAQVSQNFTFDPENGWKPQDEIVRSNEATTWDLEGKEFDAMTSNNNISNTLTLHNGEGNTASADYSIVATAPADKTDHYKSFTLEGTASGKLVHEFGESKFTMVLEDADNNVVFDGTGYATYNGVNTYYANISTETTWAYGSFYNTPYSTTTTFEQKIQDAA